MKVEFKDTEIINPDEASSADKFFRVCLSPIGGWYGIFCESYEHLEDALEKLGEWCDDHAKGYTIDCSEMSDEELDNGSYHFVNGALDCALDLSECTREMVEEYSVRISYKKVG